MKPHLAILLAGTCFATIGVFVKLIGNNVPIMTLVFLRLLIGMLFALAVVPFFDRKTFKVSRKDLRDYFFVGLVMAVSLPLYVAANLYAPIQNAILINKMSPFLVFVLAYFVLREKVTKIKLISMAVAFLGLLIINPFQGGEYAFGNTLALISAGGAAVMAVVMRKTDRCHGIGDLFWFFLFAALLLSPFPFLYGFGDIMPVLPYVIGLGVVGTGMAYFFYNLGLEKTGAEEGSIITAISTPLVGIFLAVVIISEPLDPMTIYGGAVLVGAGLILEVHRRELRKMGKKIEHGIEMVEDGVESVEHELEKDVREIRRAISGKKRKRKSK